MYLLYVFAFGVGHLAFYPALPSFWYFLVLAIFAGLVAVSNADISQCLHKITSIKLKAKVFRCLALVIVSYCAGALAGLLLLQSLLNDQLPESLDRQYFDVQFKILKISESSKRLVRFEAQLLKLRCLKPRGCEAKQLKAWVDSSARRKVTLSWYAAPNLIEGQHWQARLKLIRPRGLVNFGGFDYQAWLLSQGIAAKGIVKDGSQQLLAKAGNPSIGVFENLRQSVRAKMFLSETGLLHFERFHAALLLGDKSGLHQADWNVLQSTGTIHLMAISGLHVGLVAGIGFKLGQIIGHILSLMFRNTSTRFVVLGLPSLFSVGLAFFYAALASFSIPTQRAFIAVVLVNLAIYWGIRFSRWQALGIALVLVSLLDPLAWTNQGFILSFWAVALLIYTLSARPAPGMISGLIKVQLVLFLGLFVPLILLGLPFSLSSPIANFIAVPAISLVIVPGLFLSLLLSLIGFGEPILVMVDQCFEGLWIVLTYLSSADGLLWWLSKPLSISVLISALFGLLLCFLPRGLSLRPLGVMCCLLALIAPGKPKPPLRVDVLDVGQGLAMVIETPASATIYDTGPAYSDAFNSGARIVWPHLIRYGLRSADLVVSHGDNDHAGGAEALIERMNIGRYLYGEMPEDPSQAGEFCRAGQSWQSGEVDFKVLWPYPESIWQDLGVKVNSNNRSCVLLLSFGSQTVLLTGDIDKTVEQALINLDQLPRNLNVLIAPHHGSKTSSSRVFIEHVNPEHVVFSAAYKSRYRHPASTVVKRYEDGGVETMSTAESGAVSFIWKAEGVPPKIVRARDKHARPWH